MMEVHRRTDDQMRHSESWNWSDLNLSIFDHHTSPHHCIVILGNTLHTLHTLYTAPCEPPAQPHPSIHSYSNRNLQTPVSTSNLDDLHLPKKLWSVPKILYLEGKDPLGKRRPNNRMWSLTFTLWWIIATGQKTQLQTLPSCTTVYHHIYYRGEDPR